MIYFRPNKRESEIIWNRERKVEIDSRDEEGERSRRREQIFIDDEELKWKVLSV